MRDRYNPPRLYPYTQKYKIVVWNSPYKKSVLKSRIIIISYFEDKVNTFSKKNEILQNPTLFINKKSVFGVDKNQKTDFLWDSFLL